MASKYTIAQFIGDAKRILDGSKSLEEKKIEIGEHLLELAKRDDLFRYGKAIGHTDATNVNFLLYREPPSMTLILAGLFSGYGSPVHEHGDYWAVATGYKGHDRWDMYERMDDGTRPGYADLRLFDEWHVTPGKFACMPAPPRAIHSHNNMAADTTYELIFLGAPSPTPEQRLIYDVEGKTCWPTWRSIADAYQQPWRPGVVTPTAEGLNLKTALGNGLRSIKQRMLCPICAVSGPTGLFRLGNPAL